ncbi:hypothetical protein [Microbacterium sp. cx-55]|uniref:hypothetical protein n=1 Tax=Microbacterium sp. cx-55 TaxID=2875948 RepID=UPI001CBBDBC6|nr:hypothetical protein [Microbacterium sp. cx-55]MBZ4486284.1 hypothetical protein [Microbacterium sp. cx-55]
MTSGARVTIGRNVVTSSWDGSNLVALDGLKIVWGRTDPYDDPEPSLLTLRLLDRTGVFVNDPTRIGQEVVVTMIDPQQVVFRGAIAKPKATRRRVYNPLLGADETVWIVTLTAVDPLAALGMAVYPGDAIDGWVEGAGGWPEVSPNQRLDRLYAAGASGLVDGFEAVQDIAGTPVVARRVHGQAAADARTALELLRQVYRGVPLGVANYDPATHMVTIGRFADSSPVSLTYSGGIVRLALGTGHIVPASRVGVSGYDLESSVDAAIDAVQVGYWWYGNDPNMTSGSQRRTVWTQGFIEARTNRYDPRTRRVLKVDTEYMRFQLDLYGPGVMDPFNRFPAWLLDQVTRIVNKLNGQLRVPRLTFDADRAPLPAALEAVLYRPTAQAVPLYFAGSVFNGMPMVGPQFQIIGGTLTYEDGWRHEVSVCSTGPAPAATLTVAQLVTNPAPTLSDFDPDISLADLGQVTTGLA